MLKLQIEGRVLCVLMLWIILIANISVIIDILYESSSDHLL